MMPFEELSKILLEDGLAKLRGEKSPHEGRIKYRKVEPGEEGMTHGGTVLEIDGNVEMRYPYVPLQMVGGEEAPKPKIGYKTRYGIIKPD